MATYSKELKESLITKMLAQNISAAELARKERALAEARRWVQHFVNWYNTEHKHSGINYVSPAERHKGEDKGKIVPIIFFIHTPH